MWLSHTQSTMPDKTPQGHPDGFPFHGITFLPFWFSMSPFRFRRSLFQGFPVPCLNIRMPFCDLSHQQESMGLPKFFDVSLPACHGLSTPADLHILASNGCSCIAFGVIGDPRHPRVFISELYQHFRGRGSPYS